MEFLTTDQPVGTGMDEEVGSPTERSLEGNIFPPKGIMLATYIVSGVLGIVGNGLVIIVLLSFKKLRQKITNAFLIHQSAIDFLSSLVLLLLSGTQQQYGIGGLAGEILCRMWLSTNVLWVLFTASTYNLCVLSLEKYFSIVHPISHKKAFTMQKAVVGMSMAWVISILINVFDYPTSALQGTVCIRWVFWPSSFAQRANGVINCIVKFFVPLGIMFYTYGRILHVINMKVAPSNDATNVAPTSHGNARYLSARRNTIKMLLIVCACFILCWSWNQFFFLAFNLGAALPLDSAFFQFSIIAVFINGCINPFIYIFKYDDFKRAFRKLVRVVFPCLPAPATGDDSDSYSTQMTNNSQK